MTATCPDCGTPNVTVCPRPRCGSHCECYCSEPTPVSLGITCGGCGGSGSDDCYCGQE